MCRKWGFKDMIKYFCDCCGDEKSELYKFSYKCHLNGNIVNVSSIYIDSYGERVSGRDDTISLCSTCYNKIVGCAVDKYHRLKPALKEKDSVVK